MASSSRPTSTGAEPECFDLRTRGRDVLRSDWRICGDVTHRSMIGWASKEISCRSRWPRFGETTPVHSAIISEISLINNVSFRTTIVQSWEQSAAVALRQRMPARLLGDQSNHQTQQSPNGHTFSLQLPASNTTSLLCRAVQSSKPTTLLQTRLYIV
jgi:hypothetical protein